MFMKILIAEDDRISRRLLEMTLGRLKLDVIVTENGAQALEVLEGPDPPQLAILDWMMPELDGIEVCQAVRERPREKYTYIIFLTARGQTKDIVQALESGADDYLIKPFDPQELRSRLQVGFRVLKLESALAGKVEELEKAIQHVKTLQGLLPICMYCKKIRDDTDSWHRLESYIERHSQAMFTHSLCTDCREEHFPKPQKPEPVKA
jgi:sigma-B regulation protein RsbU (phosphoserine phosphatase)